MGNGSRTMIILVAVLVVSGLIGVLVMGFSGRHIRRNSAAMATPVGETTGPGYPLPLCRPRPDIHRARTLRAHRDRRGAIVVTFVGHR
jgi:hypothetical protein